MDEETEEYENHEDEKSTISADLIRGHINTIILRSLYDRDKYGYEIINEINEKSHGQYTLKQPTLYSALKRLENQGYIQAYWKSDEVSSGGRRKYFRLTESGKEITEKNQAEWEYSRTVIDNLISDKSFDFSQPAPTPVDFKLLRQSTSRVPTGQGGNENENDSATEQPEEEKQPIIQVVAEPVIEAVTFTSLRETAVVLEPDEVPLDEKPAEDTTADKSESVDEDGKETVVEQSVTEQELTISDGESNVKQETTEDTEPAEQNENNEEIPEEKITEEATENTVPPEEAAEEKPPVYNGPSALEIAAAEYQLKYERELAEKQQLFEQQQAEEQRRIAHENYVKLVSGELEKKPEPVEDTANENLNTEDYIYANRPETERDYRNLVDRLFEGTLRPSPSAGQVYEQIQNEEYEPQQEEQQAPEIQVQTAERSVITNSTISSRYNDINEKAYNDGIKIQTSESNSTSAKATRTTYNKGATLFKCSLIVGVIILLEFTLCLLFKEELAISLVYPFIILSLGLADILVCGILFGAGYGRQVRKPTSQKYILTSMITTALILLIIVLFAIVLSVNWSSITDVLTKVIIPCIIALNIPIFTLTFYLFTK